MTNVHDCPESDVITALEPPASEVDTAREVKAAISDDQCPTSNVETAREITESVRAALDQSIGFLQPNPQRSVTEIQAPHHKFGQTPLNFDSRAASSAKDGPSAPPQTPGQLTPADTTLKTALENPSQTKNGTVS